jgi:hypothetical protein
MARGCVFRVPCLHRFGGKHAARFTGPWIAARLFRDILPESSKSGARPTSCPRSQARLTRTGLAPKASSASPKIPPSCAPHQHPRPVSPFAPTISIPVEQRRFPPAPRDPKNTLFTPARKNRAQISHVSFFQNEGSAHPPRAKPPRNHTLDSDAKTRAHPTFSRVHTPRTVFPDPFSTPQNTPESNSSLSRNPIAPIAQQSPVG